MRPPAARLVADDTDWIAFDPTASVPELVDPNPDGGSSAAFESAVAALASDGLFA